MGCSPSKGKLFSKSGALGFQSTPPAEAPQVGLDHRPKEVEDKPLKPEEKEERLQLTEEHCSEKVASNTTTQNIEDVKEAEVSPLSEVINNDAMQTDEIKKTEKQKKNRSKKRSIEKQKKSSIVKTKVDFPPHMVRAHQAAYSFLSPNISKYETLLGLLDNAAQTQMSLQPMMSALVLRFDEINQALEEMAEEGELMLKEHGDYMALPSGMITQPARSVKPSTDPANTPDQPPDLLQQLLQHSAEKMKLVGGSVQAVGDKTLGEAVEYFSSLSKMLAEKLQAKQKAEHRLTQVLARVEGAAMRKSHPEDAALHSEDSGIGGENESLTGSERHRRHRGSAGSGSCGSGVNIRGALDNCSSSLTNKFLMMGHNEDDEEDDDEEDQDDEDDEDDESDRPERKRSSSFPSDANQANYLPLHASCSPNQQPLTAAKPEDFSPSRCVNVLTELQRSQRDLDQKMKNMSEFQEIKDSESPHYNLNRAGLRRHSLNGPNGAYRSPIRKNKPPCSLPMLTSQPLKRHSVRKLINTFSQGVDGRPGQSLANIPPHIRRPNKSRILLLSDTVNSNEGGLVINDNNNNNSWPDSRDDLDVDNLPPPPPEVLMDNSFQSNEDQSENGEESQDSVRKLPVINQRTGISQKLKVSMQNVEVLPNKATVRPRSVARSPADDCQGALIGAQNEKLQPEMATDQETEAVNCLYQQARKIIPLHNAAESPNGNIVDPNCQEASSLQARMTHSCESNKLCDSEMSSCSLPVIAPPVSRVRLPPSCPSVRHHFPSPPSFRPPSTSRPSSRPNSPRTITRATNNPEEIVPSVSFKDARSFFLRNEVQNSETCLSSGSPLLPRQWGEQGRGRLTTRKMESSTRRTQSEQRPYGTSHPEAATDVSLPSISANGCKPAVTK